jgi:6,7-dimethyl-8-ribityllumazine synthase
MKVEKKNTVPEKTGGHALIIEAKFYQEIADGLFAGAARILEASGMTYERIDVPGSMELPVALQLAAMSGRYDAFVVTGCVIRGETKHFDVVVNESTRGVTEVALKHSLAVGNAILTVETIEQAQERADPDRLDKGGDAARAAVRMLTLKRQWSAA